MKTNQFNQLGVAIACCLISANAQAIMTIKPLPMDGHQHHRGAAKPFALNGFENSTLTFITPELEQKKISAENGRFSLRPTGKDNYHAVVASRIHNQVHESAIRYVYFNGKPTGRSPSELTSLQKATLEIVPDPLPREHWHYKASDEISFVIRFKNQHLASLPVTLSTSHATILEATTDTQGRVSFTLPDDFQQVKPGREANKSGEILVHIKYADNDQQYASWLSADYQVNPAHWQDTGMGALVATGGFAFGAFITGLGFRRNNKESKQ